MISKKHFLFMISKKHLSLTGYININKRTLLLEKDSLYCKTYFYCKPINTCYFIYKITDDKIYLISEKVDRKKWPKNKKEEMSCFTLWHTGGTSLGDNFLVLLKEKYPRIKNGGIWAVG